MEKMRFNIMPFLLFFVLSIWGCEEYYIPEIETTANSIVVEAILTDKAEIMKLKLSRTNPFDGRSSFRGERNAEIKMETSSGQTYNFHQYASGFYQSDDTIRAITGEGYFLEIKTTDGETYRSEVEVMMPHNDIANVQFDDSIYREINYDYWGEPYVSNFDGIFISVLPETPENLDVGYLYKWSSLVNYYVYSTESISEYSYYCWKNMRSNTIYVYDYDKHLQGNTLKLDNIHFLSYFNIYPNNLDSTRFKGTVKTTYASSFYYYLEQFTITKKGAEFWKSVKKQSEATGKLFDPVEEEIITNIYCVSNPTLKCFGFFNTASYAKRIIMVDLNIRKIDQYFDVEAFPVPKKEEDCLLNEVTEYWY